jgi:hypothetical protein
VARPDERVVRLSLSPDPSPLLGIDARGRAPMATPVPGLFDARGKLIGPSLAPASWTATFEERSYQVLRSLPSLARAAAKAVFTALRPSSPSLVSRA